MSREILSPPLMRLGANRCYRVNLVHEDFGGDPAAQRNQPEKQRPAQGYLEQDMFTEDDDDVDDGTTYTVEELPNSMFKLTMHIAQSFYGGLIGFKGQTKRRIETETRTEIFVPRNREGHNAKTEDVSIKGKTRSSVCAARRKINLLTASLRKRMRPTHFTCVPLNHGDIRTNYLEFKQQILAASLPGIDELLFQTEDRIHLTLITCVLLDDAERTKAVELLQGCREFVKDLRTPLEIKISGLEIMNDDPSSVRVLYAGVDSPDLQKFADRVASHFKRNALGYDEFERDHVKLHMTVMNNSSRSQRMEKAPTSFDAREILKRFGDFNFGTVECNEVQLCVIREKGESSEFYKITGALKF